MINDIIQLLGVANPQLSARWNNGGDNALTDDKAFGITCQQTDNFLAPLNGYLTKGRELERIILPNGASPDLTKSFMIRADPQVYLRLTRLYASVLEGKTTNTHRPERPVPCYFVYTNLQLKVNGPDKGPKEGLVLATSDLMAAGTMTIHDQYGYPMDPMAVAASFDLFLTSFATMQAKNLTDAYKDPHLFLSQLAALIKNLPQRQTIYLSTANGDPVPNGVALFSNLAAFPGLPGVNDIPGWYQIKTAGQPIARNSGVSALTKIGAATNGKLDDNYLPGALPLRAAPLKQPNFDFLRVYAVDLEKHLLGEAPPTEAAVANSTKPLVRDGEQLILLADGTECLGAVGAINAAKGSPILLVSPVIDNDFVLPLMNGGSVPAWPAAPLSPGAGSKGIIPANLKPGFVLNAQFIFDQATVNSDVAVSLNCAGFAPGDWVRIYNRIFHEDGTETRGDGAGAMIDASKTATFRLSDPFSLVTAVNQASKLATATLMLDIVVINRGGKKRMFGNIQCPVSPADQAVAAPPQQTSGWDLNARFGISPAGISGTAYAPQNATGGDANGFLGAISGEGNPRQAPRYPTMARYDSMAASYNKGANVWQAFCGGTIFKKDALSTSPFMGNPGTPGGREFSSVGVYTAGGLLAYDIAQAAYRRTSNIAARMSTIAGDTTPSAWLPPTTNSSVNATWAAATLQTIATHCETPELAFNFSDMSNVPVDWKTFVNQVVNKVGIPAWLPDKVKAEIQKMLNKQITDPLNQRAYAEFRQEIVTSLNGRRDTYWALRQAIRSARECIYIQGNLLDHTGITDIDFAADDLIQTLKAQMTTYPRLKVILCLSREIRYGRGYEQFEAHDYQRRTAIVGELLGTMLDNSNNQPSDQVLVFSPNGFPMRAKELRHQLVIVDDMVALVGSSSLRRRGLMFDGAQDTIAMDKTIVNGKSAGIRDFRLKLLEGHLNLQGATGLTPGLQIRLRDMRESFYALRELLSTGGAGVISPLWAGNRQNLTPEKEEFANPGPTISAADSLIKSFLAAAGSAP